MLIAGTGLLAVRVVAAEGPPPTALSARTWWSLAALGLPATAVTTLLWNWGLARVPASRAGVFTNFEPVVGTAMGVLLLHDPFGATTVLGGLLIVGTAVGLSLRDDD